MHEMTPEEIAWLAGLLEGEGSFFIVWKTSTTGEKYATFRITLGMTDEDVVRRAFEMTGIGTFRGPLVQAGMGWKPVWRWEVHKRDVIAELLPLIRPQMGKRRGERIDSILYHYEHSGRGPWRHGTRHAYERMKCKCDICRSAHAKRFREKRQVASTSARPA
jgi:hypothetical protein